MNGVLFLRVIDHERAIRGKRQLEQRATGNALHICVPGATDGGICASCFFSARAGCSCPESY